jgi:catechol 2,3-dioxygenase-like lactoylglutathione lyase family enzyme
MTVPGLDVPLQLRLAPEAAAAVGGYDPLTLAVADRAALERWADHLDAVGAAHGPVAKARLGHALSFHDPDGTLLRLYTEPVGGLEVAAAEMGRPL